MISSNDITDQYLTDKISVAKIIRVSLKIKDKYWLINDSNRPLWKYDLFRFKLKFHGIYPNLF